MVVVIPRCPSIKNLDKELRSLNSITTVAERGRRQVGVTTRPTSVSTRSPPFPIFDTIKGNYRKRGCPILPSTRPTRCPHTRPPSCSFVPSCTTRFSLALTPHTLPLPLTHSPPSSLPPLTRHHRYPRDESRLPILIHLAPLTHRLLPSRSPFAQTRESVPVLTHLAPIARWGSNFQLWTRNSKV